MTIKKLKQLPDKEITALINLISDEEACNAEKLKDKLAEIIKYDAERVDTIVGREFKTKPDVIKELELNVRSEMICKMC
jgi:hypothetical protein